MDFFSRFGVVYCYSFVIFVVLFCMCFVVFFKKMVNLSLLSNLIFLELLERNFVTLVTLCSHHKTH
jgi:hypothetical protein